MKVHGYQLHSYLRANFEITEGELFDLPQGKRTVIMNALFEKFSGHRLFRDGLTNTKNMKDRFDNYRSYEHIKTLEMLAEDITTTKQKSKDRMARWKRKIHLARVERFNARKRKKIRELSQKVHLQKWEPRNKETKSRLERLRKLKEKEQGREYER